MRQKFFWDHFSTRFVTVHKCDGRDLGSISLKMAARSILNGAMKYIYPDRHFVGESEGISFTVAKGKKTCLPKQQTSQLFQKLEGDLAIIKWSQNMLTLARCVLHDSYKSGVTLQKRTHSHIGHCIEEK